MKISYSPLRYPGGKSRLYSHVSMIIKDNYKDKPVYVETYCGGFGIGIKLLLNNEVSGVILNDYDYCIYSFWKCVSSTKLHKKFMSKIHSTPITIEEWKIQKNIYMNYEDYSMLEVGFATLFLNRTNRSGILKAGPIGGYHQDGNYKIDCRFEKARITDLINQIYAMRSKISVKNEDATTLISKLDKSRTDILFNFDPPYVSAGPSLYKNSYDKNDHIELSNTLKTIKNRWLLTYDDHPLIKKLYSKENINEFTLRYSVQNKIVATELIVYSKNLIVSEYLGDDKSSF